jgi:type I restriction enzyme S subunit
VDFIVRPAESGTDDYLGLENIESWTGRLVGEIRPGSDASQSLAFSEEDVLFGKLRPYLAKVARPGFRGQCSSEFLVMRPRSFDQGYLSYCCLSAEFIDAVDASTYGVKMPRANWSFIGGLELPVPPPAEQRAIADFLDRKTAAIDDLIQAKERLIALLQEKRQALITQAVTKGLDPSVPMKDSGIEWLGAVPAHWEVTKLKWHVRVGSGSFLSNQEYGSHPEANRSHPVIGGNGVMGWTSGLNCHVPTIVVGRVGALCGNVHHVDQPCWITDNALRVDCDATFSPFFLHLTMRAMGLNKLADRNAQPLITGAKVKDQSVGVPPLHEQLQIAEQLQSAMHDASRVGATIERHVKLLREYRQSLISAAVTGQIDVSAQLADEIPA